MDPASIMEDVSSLTTIDTQPSNVDAAIQSADHYEISERPSTSERSSGPSLEKRTLHPYQKKPSNVDTGSYDHLSTPERSSGLSLEEQFQDSSSNRTSIPEIEVHMVDAEVANVTAHDEFESLEDLTVYEVFQQSVYPTSTTNYPHIFLQLRNGQIVNVENLI